MRFALDRRGYVLTVSQYVSSVGIELVGQLKILVGQPSLNNKFSHQIFYLKNVFFTFFNAVVFGGRFCYLCDGEITIMAPQTPMLPGGTPKRPQNIIQMYQNFYIFQLELIQQSAGQMKNDTQILFDCENTG